MKKSDQITIAEGITERVLNLIESHKEPGYPLYFYMWEGTMCFTYDGEYLNHKLKITEDENLETLVKAGVLLQLFKQGFVIVYTSKDNGLVSFEDTPPGWEVPDEPDGGYEPDHETDLPLYIGWD